MYIYLSKSPCEVATLPPTPLLGNISHLYSKIYTLN